MKGRLLQPPPTSPPGMGQLCPLLSNSHSACRSDQDVGARLQGVPGPAGQWVILVLQDHPHPSLLPNIKGFTRINCVAPGQRPLERGGRLCLSNWVDTEWAEKARLLLVGGARNHPSWGEKGSEKRGKRDMFPERLGYFESWSNHSILMGGGVSRCVCAQSSKHFVMLFGYTVPLDAFQGFPGGSDGKESACPAGDWSLIPGSGRSPGEGNGCPLQYSCLENSMDRGAWRATVCGVAKSWTLLSN